MTGLEGGTSLEITSTIMLVVIILGGIFAVYNLLHYIMFLLASNPKDAAKIGHELNEFERRQLVEWAPKTDDFLKHDDEHRTYDDVFALYRGENDNYSTCVFPRAIFSHPYESDYVLLRPMRQGMRLLDLGCGSGAAADYFASQCNVEIMCVTNSAVQADICRRKFEKFNGRVNVVVSDFDQLKLEDEHFDAIYAFESIGYTKNLDAWLERCWRSLKPGGRLLIRSPGSLDACRREHDYRSVTAFFENWRYNFLGANLLVFKLRRLGFDPIPAIAVLGVGPNSQLHSTPVTLEVSAAHADHGRFGAHHLAHIKGFCVRQRVQHRTCQQ